MDDTQRLRIYRPDEEDAVFDASLCLPKAGRGDKSVISTDLVIGPSDDPAPEDCLENEIQFSKNGPAVGIFNQAGGLIRRFMLFTGYSVTACWLTGCTALVPLHGIPVRQLPHEFRGPSRANMETIDLSRLSQTPLPAHIVDSGDILGVYVYGILGKMDETPPVYIPQNGDGRPTIGLPIPVRDDGTISLPQIPPIYVRGMTERQVEESVRREYVQRGIRQEGADILVSLQRARTYKVTVLRQETPNPAITGLAGGGIQLGATKRGTGQVVVLPAGENDVLRALTMSGGLPGLDAQNAIYVLRRPRPVRQRPLAAAFDHSDSALASVDIPSGDGGPEAQRNFNSSFQHLVRETKSPRSVKLNDSRKLQLGKWLPFREPAESSAFGAITLVGHSLPNSESNPSDSADDSTPVDIPPVPVRPRGMPKPWSSAPGVNRSGDGYSNSADQELSGRQTSPRSRVIDPPSFQSAEPGPRLIDQPDNQFDDDPDNPIRTPIVADGNRHIPPELEPYMATGGQVFRIPVRLRPGEEAFFNEQDILLYDGDIIFIESRETEIFYTGGLLGGGQFSLPRDYDLDMIDAISIAQGRGTVGGGVNNIGGIASVNQDITVSASRLIVIRRLADGRRVNIKIDVNKALRDENENLLVQPGDHLILRYTPMEAVGAFIERNLLAGSLIGVATQTSNLGK